MRRVVCCEHEEVNLGERLEQHHPCMKQNLRLFYIWFYLLIRDEGRKENVGLRTG
jgi:hypothetical protein